MSDDFFGDLGKTLTKAGQAAAEKTSSFFEATKLGTQIAQEQKEVEKLFLLVGEAVVRKYSEGKIELDDAEVSEVTEINAHKETILELKKKLAAVRGQKVCPSCEELIAQDAAFCPKCGAATPVEADVQPEEKVQEAQPQEEETPAPDLTNATAETKAVETEAEASEPAPSESTDEVPDAEFTEVQDSVEESETSDAVDAEFVTVDDAESPDYNEKQEN